MEQQYTQRIARSIRSILREYFHDVYDLGIVLHAYIKWALRGLDLVYRP